MNRQELADLLEATAMLVESMRKASAIIVDDKPVYIAGLRLDAEALVETAARVQQIVTGAPSPTEQVAEAICEGSRVDRGET